MFPDGAHKYNLLCHLSASACVRHKSNLAYHGRVRHGGWYDVPKSALDNAFYGSQTVRQRLPGSALGRVRTVENQPGAEITNDRDQTSGARRVIYIVLKKEPGITKLGTNIYPGFILSSG